VTRYLDLYKVNKQHIDDVCEEEMISNSSGGEQVANGDDWTCLLHLQSPTSLPLRISLKFPFLQNHMMLDLPCCLRQSLNMVDHKNLVMLILMELSMTLQLNNFLQLLWHHHQPPTPSFQLYLINLLHLYNLHMNYLHNNLKLQLLKLFNNEEIAWIDKRCCQFSLVPIEVNEVMMGPT